MAKGLKRKAWQWCAKYIKLRDAIEDFPVTKDMALVRCRACGKWLETNSKNAQASHFISRGTGGWSGVYFDERNIHICCYQCNCLQQGNAQEYGDFMLDKYGQEVIDKLRWLHKNNSYKGKLLGLFYYYKQQYEELSKIYRRPK